MYQALYRKWRPQVFDDVIGQQHVTATLKNQIISDRLSHAYIFIGTRGTGKTTCARILARAVNCEHPVNGNPCGSCPSCRAIADGSAMDVQELDAASNNGVDNVRVLRDEAVFSPAALKKRVYIIDEVHMMSTAAFNALLKLLEEPPEHLMFILATTELRKVPATILSRCQRHNFKRVDTPVLSEYLQNIASQESFTLTPEAADIIARMAEGGVRDALSLLDQCSAAVNIDSEAVYSAMGIVGKQKTCRLLEAVIARDTEAALEQFDAMWTDGKDPVSVMDELKALMRDILLIRVAPQASAKLVSGTCDPESLEGYSQQITTEELVAAIETIQNAAEGMKGIKSARTAAEICLVSLCTAPAGDSIASLRARISRLEEALASGAAARVRTEQPVYTAAKPAAPARTGQVPAAPADLQPTAPAASPRPAPQPTAPAASPQPALQPTAPAASSRPAPQPTAPAASSRPAPQPTAPAANPQPASQPTAPAAAVNVSVDAVAETVKSVMTPDLRLRLNDGVASRIAIVDGVFYIYANENFFLDRFSKFMPLIKAKVSSVHNIPVRLEKLSESKHQVKSLEELRAFPEVTFHD